ncbi:hypothetical protein D9M72_400050 [compost metagenome]
MAVEHGIDRIAHQRIFQPAAAQERKDLDRLAFDRADHGCVVQQRNAPPRAQLGQRRFELHRLVQRLLHEQFDCRLTPRAQRTAPEPAAKPFHARNAHAFDLADRAVEHAHAGVRERAAHHLGRARFVVMVAQHGDDGNVHRAQFLGEHASFLFGAVVGQVAAQQQRVGFFVRLREQAAQGAAGVLLDMDVADGGEADVGGGFGRRHG